MAKIELFGSGKRQTILIRVIIKNNSLVMIEKALPLSYYYNNNLVIDLMRHDRATSILYILKNIQIINHLALPIAYTNRRLIV